MIDWNGIKIVETDCMLPIDRVKPYARNAKRHPQEQIDEIKASIKRFGQGKTAPQKRRDAERAHTRNQQTEKLLHGKPRDGRNHEVIFRR